ncbi:MAG TPA: hypothetical protein VMM81_08380 [Acidimicrobiia bacterium]|nr:hypothetical protein [Acidimicrobiia bacterium]
MDFSKLSTGMKLALVGGALALVALFMPWYGVFGFNVSAMNAGFFAWGGCLLVVAAAVILLLKNMGQSEVKGGGFGTEQIAFYAAAAGLVFIILRFVTQTELVRLGLFVGLVGGALAAYGAFTVMKDAGIDFKPQQQPPLS